MPIEFRCPACAGLLRVPDEHAGRAVRCPACRATPVAPRAEAPPMAEVVPAAKPEPVARPRAKPRALEPAGAPRSSAKLIAGLIALIVALVGAGGFALWRTATAPAEWREFASPKGGFRVELPAPPRADIERLIDMPPDPNTVAEGTAFHGTAYAVMWTDFPDGRNGVGDDAILSGAIDGLRQEFGAGAVEGVRDLEADGFAAREAAVNVPGEGRAVFRVVVTDARLFVLAVAPSDQNGADAARFLESFRVTDPAQRASRDRRLAEARARKEEFARNDAAMRARIEEAKRDEERARKEAEAEEARREGQRLAMEKRQREEREALAAAFRAPQVGVSAPDPTKLPGLVAYLSFDKIEGDTVAIWPKGTAKVPQSGSAGSGARGGALYFGPYAGPVTAPVETLPAKFSNGASTVAGWVKVRSVYGARLFESILGPGQTHALGRTGGHKAHWVQGSADAKPFTNGVVGASSESDDKWHHLALVRDGTDPCRLVLYADGEAVGSCQIVPGTGRSERLHLGAVVRPNGVFDDGTDVPAAAVDELCAFDRALTGQEVKFLAGRTKSPEGLTAAVRFVDGPRTEPLAGVAFDVERKTVWATTAVNGWWDNRKDVESAKKVAGQLVKFSYPDFEVQGRWALPRYRDKNYLAEPSGGVPVLAPERNRLYVPVWYSSETNVYLQTEASTGEYHLFELDRLPKWEAEAAPPELTAAGKLGSNMSPLVVAPGGKWVYASNWQARAVFRMTGTLEEATEVCKVPVQVRLDKYVWLTPDGKTLRASNGVNLWDIDTEKWTLSVPRRVLARDDFGLRPFQPVAVHPDGRAFLGSSTNVIETVYGAGEPTKRLRPTPLSERSYLSVSPDGRYLFGAFAQTKKNRLFVLDARANPERLDELASIEETPERLIGGPFWVSPDGTCIVFRSGQVVRLEPVPLPKP